MSHLPYSYSSRLLTNDQLVLLGELVLRNLEVERRGSFSDTPRDIVVGAVARAEPTAEITSLADRNTTQVCADTCGRRRGYKVSQEFVLKWGHGSSSFNPPSISLAAGRYGKNFTSLAYPA